MVAKYEPVHIILEDDGIKWHWHESELFRFRELWKDGVGISELARAFRTNRRSIVLVIMDQAELGEIQQRAGGLYGG